jgi:hypothetical protein
MNPNELCDILLVIMGVCLIFFISTRKQKELFNICHKKTKKKIKKKLKVKSFDKTLSNNSNISKAFLSKKEIKNTVNDQNVIINELNNLDDSNVSNSNVTDPNVTDSNVTDSNVTDSNVSESNVTDSNEIDGYMILDNYGNIEISESENKITNLSKSSNYNSQNLSELNNFDNEFTSFDNIEIINDLEKTNNDGLNEASDNLKNTNEDLQVNNDNFKNYNIVNNRKRCDREIKGNDKEDLVYGLLQNETKSYKKINITNYENEKKCSTLKNAILHLNRTGYLKSDLVEKSWNDTFKPDCGDL